MKDIIKFRFAGIGIVVAMCAVFGGVVMLLWNAVIPEIFGLRAVNYWQAAGLLVLARILFGGLGTGHLAARASRLHGGDDSLFHHGNALREKWMNMSEDERNEFLRSRRGFPHHPFFEENFGEKDAPKNEGSKREQSDN